FSEFRFDPDFATVAFHDLLADREANPGARILTLAVQALEGDEDALGILRVDADAVVPDAEEPLTVRCLGVDLDDRRLLLAKLEGVAEQVLKQLHELGAIRADDGQGTVGDLGLALLNRRVQVADRQVKGDRAVDRLARNRLTAQTSIRQYVLD